MPKRFLYTLLAFLCAGALLAFTLTFDFGISHRPGSPVPRPLADPESTPTTSENARPFESAHYYQYNWINEHGQLIRVFARNVTLKPQGVTEAEWPGAEIHLTPSRVLQIRSERGTFYAPDSQPQRGQFYGRTVLTLFEGPGDRPVKLDALWDHGVQPQSPDVKLRVFIDEEARFDLELATLESTGPVHFVSAKVDFMGKGLVLNYNEKMGLITRLTIPAGQSLRIKTSASPATQTAPAPAAPPAAAAVATSTPAATNPANAVATTSTAPAASAAATPRTPQFYRVNFDHDVHVKTKDSRIKSDHLELVLGTGAKISEDSLLKGMGFLPSREPSIRAAGLDLPSLDPRTLASLRIIEALFAQNAPAIPMPPVTADNTQNNWPLPENLPMAPVSPDDLVITWSGPFSIEPEEHPYPRLTGPQDALVHFSGNVAVDTDRQESINSRDLEYLTKPQRVTLLGDAGTPVRIQTPKLGVLTGPTLIIDQHAGTGLILGPGSIIAPAEAALAQGPDAADRAGRPDLARPDLGGGLPPGMSIAWADRVDMTFFLKSPQRPGADPNAPDAQPLGSASSIRALREIDFRTGVHVIHPRFDLTTDMLSVALNDPDQGRQTPNHIQADGNARLIARPDPAKPDDKSQAMDLKSDSLQLELATRATGQVDPRRLIALGHVRADQPDRSIDAGKLDIDIAPFDQTVATATQSLSIRNIVADKDVRVRATQPDSAITADHLLVDAAAGVVDIFGNDAARASVSRDNGTLSAGHIYLTQTKTAQTASVNGPGTFTFVSRPSPSAATADPTSKPGVMTISWAKTMDFDQKAGTAHFTGSVQSQADFGKNVSTLYGDDQQFVFVPDAHLEVNATQHARKDAPTGTRPAEDSRVAEGAKMVKTITATQNASFRAEGWNDHVGGKLDDRLTVSGPIIVFDSPAEQMRVDGPGRMLVEDYRPAPEAVPQGADAAPAGVGTSDNQVIHFSGRGATLFTWTGSLVLDAQHNQMTLDRQVQMVHRAAGSTDVTQLDCRKFVAQLEETGGLSSWLSPHPPNATLKSVLGTDDVRILAGGRDILTDRLVYTGADKMMLLEANPGRTTQMSEINNPNTFTSRLFRWDMTRNRVTVEQPGPSRISIPDK